MDLVLSTPRIPRHVWTGARPCRTCEVVIQTGRAGQMVRDDGQVSAGTHTGGCYSAAQFGISIKRQQRGRGGGGEREQSLLSSENIIFVEGVVTMLILGHISPDMLRK